MRVRQSSMAIACALPLLRPFANAAVANSLRHSVMWRASTREPTNGTHQAHPPQRVKSPAVGSRSWFAQHWAVRAKFCPGSTDPVTAPAVRVRVIMCANLVRLPWTSRYDAGIFPRFGGRRTFSAAITCVRRTTDGGVCMAANENELGDARGEGHPARGLLRTRAGPLRAHLPAHSGLLRLFDHRQGQGGPRGSRPRVR